LSNEEVKKKKSKEVVFARPVFAKELLADDAKKRFDDLPAWQRHFIKRLIDHGDLSRAAQESGVSRHAKENIDLKVADQLSITDALDKGGLTSDTLVTHLMDCLTAEAIKFDKHQNALRVVDMDLKLRTLDMIFKLRGDYNKEKVKANPLKGVEELFQDTPAE
jgi:hypothetical protein